MIIPSSCRRVVREPALLMQVKMLDRSHMLLLLGAPDALSLLRETYDGPSQLAARLMRENRLTSLI